MSRFELVRTDAEQPWHARYVADNGRVLFSSENYTRRFRALNAIANVARMFSPTDQVWVSTTRTAAGMTSEVRYGGPGHEMYLTAHRVEIRDVDERAEAAS
jgi:uncharacterized protein YegP (UPF0339 family)